MKEDMLWELKTVEVKEAIKAGKRLDGRAFDEYRKIKIEKGVYTCADGSARVKIGDSDVPLMLFNFLKDRIDAQMLIELFDIAKETAKGLEGENISGYIKSKQATKVLAEVALAMGLKLSKSFINLLNEIALSAVRLMGKK